MISLEEAKRRRDAFMEAHGNRLTQIVHEYIMTRGVPPTLEVSREVFEAIEEAFQHWPLVDEHGEEYVGNACFTDPKMPQPNVMFKGIPFTYARATPATVKE
jgi:hypothetical protein